MDSKFPTNGKDGHTDRPFFARIKQDDDVEIVHTDKIFKTTVSVK